MAADADVSAEMEDPQIDISSLIDVSFLLLIYFLVTSTIAKEELDLRMALPSSSESTSDKPPEVEPMEIRIATDGAIFIKDNQIEPAGGPQGVPSLLEELTRWKQIADATETEPFAIVSADDEGNYQRFVDVMNVLSQVKISNITLRGFKEE